jgi:transcriptional regulator with XRE-family HTH domain
MNDKELLQKLGARLAQIREEKGMTQQQLAEAVGAKRTWIQRLEGGEIDATLSALIVITKALDFPFKDLFPSDF